MKKETTIQITENINDDIIKLYGVIKRHIRKKYTTINIDVKDVLTLKQYQLIANIESRYKVKINVLGKETFWDQQTIVFQKNTGDYDEEGFMYPPWIQCPEIGYLCIGWRMGYGEGYQLRFSEWFETLSPEEKTTYINKYPTPKLWRYFHLYPDKNNFFLSIWFIIRDFREYLIYKELG